MKALLPGTPDFLPQKDLHGRLCTSKKGYMIHPIKQTKVVKLKKGSSVSTQTGSQIDPSLKLPADRISTHTHEWSVRQKEGRRKKN
mmetsp:Transcript_49343/g.97225  ORF Transcript_49343/g.97225 Transcript_49343/m.97225 type:complete len:86 (-) Transcript_49343:693-950(-)